MNKTIYSSFSSTCVLYFEEIRAKVSPLNFIEKGKAILCSPLSWSQHHVEHVGSSKFKKVAPAVLVISSSELCVGETPQHLQKLYMWVMALPSAALILSSSIFSLEYPPCSAAAYWWGLIITESFGKPKRRCKSIYWTSLEPSGSFCGNSID